MNEIYKNVTGFEGKYIVSNFGNVKSLANNKEKQLKQTDNGHGYLYVDLYKNNIRHRKYVHILVAETFIPNAYNKPCVNHIDENKHNNNVLNLEWCTYKENNDYSSLNKKLQQKLAHKILKLDANNNPICIYASVRCAARCNNTTDVSILYAIKHNSIHKNYKYKKFNLFKESSCYNNSIIKDLLNNIVNDL